MIALSVADPRAPRWLCQGEADDPGLVHTVTTDQEIAIRSGIAASKLSPDTVHIDGALHFKWGLATQKIGVGKKESFGKRAADLWSTKMQYADGPKAFEAVARELIVRRHA